MKDLFGSEHHQNSMPTTPAAEPVANTASLENVLEDEDPAICFVKAYARKPMGMPTTSKSNQKANSLHHPRSDYYYDGEDEDEYDPHYDGDNFDFSDSDDEYYQDNN